ncbi:hypothetical protein GWQ44_04770 [Pseudomonas sp. 3MA1]|uniref:hypothetical protein n=1 Tax=Pseudomonas sp. 3MA1 TaxID=2699196 RepID=UPI0023DE0B31|nr:hypothetical protein [Pseudomonas sp. 3MA1]MDF2394838.1 hypothetical protein [Pseudomonas sp. 3MA1]
MTTKPLVEPVVVCDESTRHLCAVYLCGGYDKAKNWYAGASRFFRGQHQEALQPWGIEAELGDTQHLQIFKCMVMYVLSSGRFKFRHITYEFSVDTFDEETLDSLAWEVLAQINEW